MIIQGCDEPLTLEFSEEMSACNCLSFALYQFNKLKKRWSKEDVTIDGARVILPLTESETLELARGPAELETKWLKNHIEFGETIKYTVVEHRDKTRLTEV